MSRINQNEEKEKDFKKQNKDDDLAIGSGTMYDTPMVGGLDDEDAPASAEEHENLGGPDDGNDQDQPALEKKDDESVKFEKAIEIAQERIANDLEKKEKKRSDIDKSTNKTKSKDAKKYQFDEATRNDIDKVKDRLISAAKKATTSKDAEHVVALVLELMVKSLGAEKRNMLANAIVEEFHTDQGTVIHFVLFFCILAQLVCIPFL